MKTVGFTPYNDFKQRLLEIAVGSMSLVFFIAIIVISYFSVAVAAYILVGYVLWWLTKIVGYSNRLIRAYWRMRLSEKINWRQKLADLNDVDKAQDELNGSESKGYMDNRADKYYLKYLQNAKANQVNILSPDDIYQAVIVAMYNEDPTILESTLEAIKNSNYDHGHTILIVAHEERGGKELSGKVRQIVSRYEGDFLLAIAIEHPADLPGEAKAKAGNITYAAKWLTTYITGSGLDPEQVLVTTLDVDNRPSPNYLAEVAYRYAITPGRIHNSYQPIPMFFNNIWDAPALMRVIAASNSFWVLMEALRPHRLRNFSSHAQSLQTLLDTNYWNVASIVEDGHQYWRTFFAYRGNHQVLPIFSPVYQDAVLVDGYFKTFKAQFMQLRRWAWGVADTPFVIRESWHAKDIPAWTRIISCTRQVEGYFSWVVAPIILAVGGWLPLIINTQASESVLAIQLPTVISWILTGALLGLIGPIVTNIMSMPPKPARYSRWRSLMMVLQWALVPVTLIVFGSLAALNAQVRLLFGRYLESFNVTEKKRVSDPLSI
ncbi:MAG: glycosyltransferase family 2 protein [Candidatus Saccharimonadales bacterium]